MTPIPMYITFSVLNIGMEVLTRGCGFQKVMWVPGVRHWNAPSYDV